ncbi:EPS8 family protein [Megaselia abdita]
MAYHNNGGYSGDERDSSSCGGAENDYSDKPIYLLEHLATFTVNKETGIVSPGDGMKRLLQLEKTTGIWSQKMQLCLHNNWVMIMDYETGNVIERFPASQVVEPTAFTSNDPLEIYNNILVFIVGGANSGSRSEMHIFQSQSISAVHLVEDLKQLRNGKMLVQQREIEQQHHQKLSVPRDIHHEMTVHETDSEIGGINDETSSTSSDKYERDVAVLNHCFDDIEKFIARLQHAAAASRELEKRRRNRKSKKKDPGEGLLTLRTRPPHEKEFIDIFAKFKLSFNLLAKLKAHIHDPNAPELVHFLFTPLALIVEASSDTYYEAHLPSRVINPLLTREAVNLLINCVTSKETELWRSLGDAWTLPRDLWKGHVGSYHPVFFDGWSPDYPVVDELEQHHAVSPTTPLNIQKRRTMTTPPPPSSYHHREGNYRHMSESNPPDHGLRDYGDHYDHNFHGGPKSDISLDSIDRKGGMMGMGGSASMGPGHMNPGGMSTTGRPLGSNGNANQAALMNSIIGGLQNLRTVENSVLHPPPSPQIQHMEPHPNIDSWISDLQQRGAKIVQVTYPRTANNDKELTVTRGEYLEVLDDTRKWWKARNSRGQVAHVPHTIVTAFN